MKNFVYRSLTITLAILVLLSSIGFGFVEHQCLTQEKSMNRAPSTIENCGKPAALSCCCKEINTGSNYTILKQNSCCKENLKYEKLENITSGLTYVAKVLKGSPCGVPFLTRYAVPSFIKGRINSSGNPPHQFTFTSLLYGRSMLIFVQSFLI